MFKYSIFLFNQMYLGEVDTQANYVNDWDKNIVFECDEGEGEAIVGIKSVFSTSSRDRRFEFSCAKIVDSPAKDCKWHANINEYRLDMDFTCPSDFFISGLKSYHTNKKEDRKWSVKCCRILGYRTESCELTKDYINRPQGSMNYQAKLSVCEEEDTVTFFTGFLSYFDFGKK